MPKYAVHIPAPGWYSIGVEADDPDAAIDKAIEMIPRGPCAQCSGWGQPWSFEVGDALETQVVEDEDGKVVWGSWNPDE